MRISYLILADKNPSQISTFINTLDSTNANFFIHINEGSNIESQSLLEELKNKDSVFFLKQSHKVNWGGYETIIVTLMLLKECLSKVKCDYISLHGDEDLPIKNKNEIIEYIKKNKDKEFVNYFEMPVKKWWPDNGLERIEYYWFIDEYGFNKSYVLYEEQKSLNMKRKYFSDLKPYGGSQWWTITRECAEFIIDYVNKNTSFCDYYKNTLLPEEGFFQTIVLNSYFKDRVLNNNLRYIDWNSGPQHPRILNLNDYDKLIYSDRLFARKFDTNVDERIIKKIINRVME